MLAQINYSRYGQSYTETFTFDKAKKELLNYGYPEAEKLNEKQCFKALHEIYNF